MTTLILNNIQTQIDDGQHICSSIFNPTLDGGGADFIPPQHFMLWTPKEVCIAKKNLKNIVNNVISNCKAQATVTFQFQLSYLKYGFLQPKNVDILHCVLCKKVLENVFFGISRWSKKIIILIFLGHPLKKKLSRLIKFCILFGLPIHLTPLLYYLTIGCCLLPTLPWFQLGQQHYLQPRILYKDRTFQIELRWIQNLCFTYQRKIVAEDDQ